MNTFGELGYFIPGEVIDAAKCRGLLVTIKNLQCIGPDIMISEDKYRSLRPSSATNAGPVLNLLDKCNLELI